VFRSNETARKLSKREWDKKDIELRRVEAERDALKNEGFWKGCIVLAFALSLFIVGFIVVALLQQVGGAGENHQPEPKVAQMALVCWFSVKMEKQRFPLTRNRTS
jgi:hypothetical protein